MNIYFKEKRFASFKIKSFLWLSIVGMLLYFSNAAYAANPVTISHQLVGYTENGPTLTLDFSLSITNNGNVALSNSEISITPLGHSDKLLEPLSEESSLYIGNIPASTANISLTYTLTSAHILPKEEFNNFPLFWTIKYTDEAGQTQSVVVESQPASLL